ncbi:MAG: hypothetical protein JO219_07705 [Candidatus Eremiobacteraeota bacterium]|nr:hypothetical protein [Candidatus Eremiobacteraeota bacterium]
MRTPNADDLVNQVLRAASEGDGVTQDDLRKRLTFAFDMYEGSAAAPSLAQILRFSRRTHRAQQRLLEAKLVCQMQGMLRTTRLGEAFLHAGCRRIDEATLARLAESLPTQESLPLEQAQPMQSELADTEAAESESEPVLDAKALMAATRLKYYRHGKDLYSVTFDAVLRTWTLEIWFSGRVVRARTFVMRAPKTGHARVQLLEAAMRVDEIAVPHFFVDDRDGLYLGVDERQENIDAASLRSLIFTLFSVAADQYSRLYRLVTSEDALATLEAAYKRSGS